MSKLLEKKKPYLEARAKYWFNRFIRLRDTEPNGACKCISSGQWLRFGSSDCHAGHFYNAGNYPTLRYNEDNVHAQGESDNYFKGANLLEYRKNLIKKIGEERVNELDRLSEVDKRRKKIWGRIELIEIIEKYKSKCKEFERN